MKLLVAIATKIKYPKIRCASMHTIWTVKIFPIYGINVTDIISHTHAPLQLCTVATYIVVITIGVIARC